MDFFRTQFTDLLPELDTDNCSVNFGSPPRPPAKQIFAGLCFYLNGSTAPLISDHKLKHMLSAHGANHSITLGRRTVTHVILGTVNAKGGCGGGLAATKIQKEVARTGGKAVKYITVEWLVFPSHKVHLSIMTGMVKSDVTLTDICRVLESIKAGHRLPESCFAPLRLAQKTQGSVFGMMNRSNASKTAYG